MPAQLATTRTVAAIAEITAAEAVTANAETVAEAVITEDAPASELREKEAENNVNA